MLELTEAGLYCPLGDFHIDPIKPVKRAILTHAHADHAIEGSTEVWAHPATAAILGVRWQKGADSLRSLPYREPVVFGDGVDVSLHPAGHILGSSQVSLQRQGERWVVTGDFKRQRDPTCEGFEPISCDTFITEATFALPVFKWPEPADVAQQILSWAASAIDQHGTAVLYAYSLGKTQRLLMELALAGHQSFAVHSSADRICQVYRDFGVDLPDYKVFSAEADPKSFENCLVIVPPMMQRSKRFSSSKTPAAFVSGWMRLRGTRRRRAVAHGFVMSDHADWPALLKTASETQAGQVYVTHGYCDILARYLADQGQSLAQPLTVLRRGDEEEGY